MEREYLAGRGGLPGTAGSVWLAERERPQRGSLTGEVTADVVVVGAGLCGTLTAQALVDRGAKVVLLEARRVGSAVSGHTTAKATAQHDLVSSAVPRAHAAQWLDANARAVGLLEKWCARTHDGAGFERVDSHVYVTDPAMGDLLEDEARLFGEVGWPGGLVADSRLPNGAAGAVWLGGQAQFDPVALIDGLLNGGHERLSVYEDSRVQEVDEENGYVSVRTSSGEVRAGVALFTSHVPFFDTLLYMTRLFQERVYAMEVEVAEAPPAGMWYSTEPGAVAWRTHGDRHRLVVSGIGHKAGQGGDERMCYTALEAAARERLGELTVRRWWSTQDSSTPDRLPYIGKMLGRDRCYMATGFNGWGMTTSAVAAEVLSALVSGEQHDLEDMLSATRVGAKGAGKLAVENADFMVKALTQEVVKDGDPADVAPGSGRAMRVAGKGHVAVARAEDGTVMIHNAHCTHMRCGVEYNEAEGTWDCPCHGSRFLSDGSWLHGPTRRGLDSADK